MKKILVFIAAAACAFTSWAQTNQLSATVSGDKLTVSLNNETNYVAFQMDIVLPEGVTVDANGAIKLNEARLDKNATVSVAGAENSDFTVAYNTLSDGKVRVIAYNLANREIQGATGELFTVTLNGYEEGEISISNVKFVDTALVEQSLATAIAEAGEASLDVNGDGEVDAVDALAILQDVLDETNTPAYDLNADGETDAVDALVVLQYVLDNQ